MGSSQFFYIYIKYILSENRTYTYLSPIISENSSPKLLSGRVNSTCILHCERCARMPYSSLHSSLASWSLGYSRTRSWFLDSGFLMFLPLLALSYPGPLHPLLAYSSQHLWLKNSLIICCPAISCHSVSLTAEPSIIANIT